MFDRVALINLDRRRDRLGAFQAKIEGIPDLHDHMRYRAVDGRSVSVPGFFVSGGGAWGCRQSHLRVLEDALMDNVKSLLVLEDDVRFVPDFPAKLAEFMRAVPDDWDGLMLGGQDHTPGPADTGIPGVVRARNTQRTHAYAVRGVEAIQDLYRLWARCDKHIDHVFGTWQTKWNVYQPKPFLCGQDETQSDISGRMDSVRYWSAADDMANADRPITVLQASRTVAEALRVLGFHFGNFRDPVSGKDKGMTKIVASAYPLPELKAWVDLIVNESLDQNGVPGIWHMPEVLGDTLKSRLSRPVVTVEAKTVSDAVKQLPALLRPWIASQTVWIWRGKGFEKLESLAYHGFHRGHWKDEISGLDMGIRQAVETDGKIGQVRNIVKQLDREIGSIKYGKMLLAHPDINHETIAKELPGRRIVELAGDDVSNVLSSFEASVTEIAASYTQGE